MTLPAVCLLVSSNPVTSGTATTGGSGKRSNSWMAEAVAPFRHTVPLCLASGVPDEMSAHHAVPSMIQITTAYRVAFPIAISSRNSRKRTRMRPATKVSASPPIGAQASSRDQTP